MRLGRLLLLAAVLVVVGGGAIWFVTTQLNQADDDVPVIVTKSVLAISQSIVRGERLTREKINIIPLPENNVQEFMFVAEGDAKEWLAAFNAEGYIARFDMDFGTILTHNMVVEDPSELDDYGSNHAVFIPKGKVAFPIPISRFSSVAFGLSQGDRVNVIATMLFVDLDQQYQTMLPNNTANILPPGQGILLGIESYLDSDSSTVAQYIPSGAVDDFGVPEPLENSVAQILSSGSVGQVGRTELDAVLNLPFYIVPSEDTQRPRLISQTVLEGAYVLQMGTFPKYITPPDSDAPAEPIDAAAEVDAAAAGETPVELPPALVLPDIVTLIVSPQEAVTLNYLLYTGAELTIALRSAQLDPDEYVSTIPVSLEFLMNTYGIQPPNRLSYGVAPPLEDIEAPTLTNDIPTPTPQP